MVAFGQIADGAGLVGHAGGELLVGELVVVDGDDELADVVVATGAAGGFASGLHRGQHQGHQHADDGDDDEQFDKRTPNAWAAGSVISSWLGLRARWREGDGLGDLDAGLIVRIAGAGGQAELVWLAAGFDGDQDACRFGAAELGGFDQPFFAVVTRRLPRAGPRRGGRRLRRATRLERVPRHGPGCGVRRAAASPTRRRA